MRTCKRVLVWLGAATAVAILFVFAVRLAYESMVVNASDRELRSKWELVVPGMTEERVVALLGVPDHWSRQFHLGQRQGYEDAYDRAARSGSTYYLSWNREIDLVYTVGFDPARLVRIKEKGGT
jgi:hypothetical protein